MDKYQKEYFSCEHLLGFSVNMLNSKESEKYLSIDTTNDVLTIKQDSDITKTKYVLTTKKELFVKSISLFKNGKWEECDQKTAVLDFENRAERLRIVLEDDIVDAYEVSIQYIEADKETYFKQQREKQRKNLIDKASINVQTGNNLVNIYFQPCCDAYYKTEITLYKNHQLIAIYAVNKKFFFKAITALACGSYQFTLKQFDKNNNLLFETDEFKFYIAPNSNCDDIGF